MKKEWGIIKFSTIYSETKLIHDWVNNELQSRNQLIFYDWSNQYRNTYIYVMSYGEIENEIGWFQNEFHIYV